MSLLALLGGGGGGGTPPPALPAVPTEAPWNPDTYLHTPTPDGSGSTVHPGVYDFGSGRKWHGWRFWMVHTPFYMANDNLENPCILVSNDARTWVEPAGIANPIYPEPPNGRFNSDPDLEYDPRTDELVLIYREQQNDASHDTFYARSHDGITWPARATRLDWTRPGTFDYDQLLSPSIIRRAEGDWWLFAIRKGPSTLVRYRAAGPEGPWGTLTTCTGFASNPWHLDIIWDGSKFLAIVDCLRGANDGLKLGTSTDGHAWAFNNTPVIVPRPGTWDEAQTYRATHTPHENGTHMRVWYSASGADSYRVGYTELPLTLWPTV